MTLAILSLEDEVEVRDALERDLTGFWNHVRLETADSAEDAWEAIRDIEQDGDELALVLSDHRLPGRSGVDFLVELAHTEGYEQVRSVLVTGQADQDDTIRALNQAALKHYIAKPWKPEELQEVVREQLTDYVLNTGTSPLPYLPVLNGVRAMEAFTS